MIKRSFKFKCFIASLVILAIGVMCGIRLGIPFNRFDSMLKNYQIRCTADSAFVYVNNLRIGATAWGHDGIDSIITADNK